jgi:hypothetical protein
MQDLGYERPRIRLPKLSEKSTSNASTVELVSIWKRNGPKSSLLAAREVTLQTHLRPFRTVSLRSS